MTVEQGTESKIKVTPVSEQTRALIRELYVAVSEAEVNKRRGGRGDASLSIYKTVGSIIRERKGPVLDLGSMADEIVRLADELKSRN